MRHQPFPPATTVLSVDAYDLARRGIAYTVHRYPDLRLVAGVTSAEAALEAIARTRPTVVTVSDTLPGAWSELAARLRAIHPHLGLVAVSHHTDDGRFPLARDAGMSAFLSRHAPSTALVAAIRHAAAAPASFRTFGVPWTVQQRVHRTPSLSPREREVLDLMRDGLSADEIAGALRIRTGTVRTYVNRLYAKLDVGNRYQALVAAAGDLPVGDGDAQAATRRVPAASGALPVQREHHPVAR